MLMKMKMFVKTKMKALVNTYLAKTLQPLERGIHIERSASGVASI